MSNAKITTKVSSALLMGLVVMVPIWVNAGNDPTRPPVKAPAAKKAGKAIQSVVRLDLSSILIAPDRRQAVINGKFLKQGDLIEGARVVSIEPGYVILSQRGKSVKLKLAPALKMRRKKQ